MTATHANQIIDGYLKRLDGELADLPPARRNEVSGQIAEHIAEARAGLRDETDADLLTILDRLGDPEEIANEARASFDVPAQRPGALEIFALLLLGVGGVVLVVPPVLWALGTGLVWRSKVWAPRAKYMGVYLPFVVGLGLLALSILTGGLFGGNLIFVPFAFALLACILLPLGSAVFLGIRVGRRLPVLAWAAIAIVGLAVYVPAISTFIPARATAFISAEPGAPATCGGFYGTVRYASGLPLAASVPVSVGICWDGQRVTKTWGPDCYPEYGPGLVVKVQGCSVTDVGDGSLIVSVQSSVTALTSFTGTQGGSVGWRITPDGRFSPL